MRVSIFAVFTLTVLFPAGAAFARAPTLEELPTVERLQEEAQKAIDEARAAAEEAARDPKMDTIEDYAEGRIQMAEFKKVTVILANDKEQEKYRQAAADAIRKRFGNIPASDPSIEKVKRLVGREIVALLNARDQPVRVWVSAILTTFWVNQARRIAYAPDGPYRDRHKAYKKWKEFLDGK